MLNITSHKTNKNKSCFKVTPFFRENILFGKYRLPVILVFKNPQLLKLKLHKISTYTLFFCHLIRSSIFTPYLTSSIMKLLNSGETCGKTDNDSCYKLTSIASNRLSRTLPFMSQISIGRLNLMHRPPSMT